MRSFLRAGLASLVLLSAAFAQEGPAAGHYDGVIQAPDNEVKFSIDIENGAKGWTGFLSMNQGPRELPLDKFTIKGDTVSWTLRVPNPPAFEGKWDKASSSIKGTVAGPNGSVPFELTRTGEAKKIVAAPSTPLLPEFAGTWEGTLEVGGRSMRLRLVLKQGEDGKAAGTLTSLDQGNSELPISTIKTEGDALSFEIRMINGNYKGKLNEAKTEVAGEWTQGPRTLPLTFKKQQ